jgi:hypothetical protein
MFKFKIPSIGLKPFVLQRGGRAVEKGTELVVTFRNPEMFISFADSAEMKTFGFSVDCTQYRAKWEGDFEDPEKVYELEDYRYIVKYQNHIWRFESSFDESPEFLDRIDLSASNEDAEKEIECWILFYD